MRTDRLYLADMVAAADAIARFIADLEDDAAFYTDELRQSAILQKLIVIGVRTGRGRDVLQERPIRVIRALIRCRPSVQSAF